ncbi:hypothetical protein IEO21_06200 [Rhodonia placenta]|uniref:F-box domain-containing protein n=1 Tax=Rhodonia placenta TaxID=104341 RepID=A0A8H7U1I5_9APHY|nr:hypothetical protein IEO21_06200 [Postia placenta]
MHILDDVAEEQNYDAIARCARVCRFFEHMCKKHLQDDLTFSSEEGVEHLKTDTAEMEIGGWRGPQFATIVGERDSKAIPHVATFASRFAGRWTQIWVLTIVNASWPSSLRAANAAVFRDLSRLASITRLVLEYVTFPSIVTFGALVSALPRLERLHLRDVTLTGSSGLFDPRTLAEFRLLPPTKNLQHITLGHVSDYGSHKFIPSAWPCYTELLAFIVAVSNPCGKSPRVYPWGSVRFLRLNVWWKFSSSSIARLLRALPSLENLDFATTEGDIETLKVTYVPAHPRLEPITISVHYRQCDLFANANPKSLRIDGCDASCLGVREILSHVTSRCVSSVNIRFNESIQRDDEGWSEGLSQLDTALSLPVFNNLVHVLLSVNYGLDLHWHEVEKWTYLMKSCLAIVDKRGILGKDWKRYDSKTDEDGNVEIIEVPAFEGGAPSEAMVAYTAWVRSEEVGTFCCIRLLFISSAYRKRVTGDLS